MSHGRASNDLFRVYTQQIAAAGVSKRQTCALCRKHKSQGQFPLNSDTCITCKPQGKNFRRGELP
jgi:hypothetical protein